MGFFGRLLGGKKTDAKSLVEFARKGDIAAIRRALDADSSVVSRVDDNGMTLLHWVAATGDTDIAAMLLDTGATIDAPKSDDGWTPLHFAALAGKVEMAAFLAEHGAALDARAQAGDTPLELARQQNQNQVVEVLQKQMKGAEELGPTTDECVQQGKAAGERQDWAAAIESFTHALEVEPDCVEAHFGLACTYSATLDIVKAKEHYAEVERLDPGLAAKFAESPAGMMLAGRITIIGE